MRLKNLLRDDFVVCGETEKDISAVAFNSKEVSPGHLFIAIKGQNIDGHNFINEAIKNGAVAVVYETGFFKPEDYGQVSWIGVKDSRDALAWISSRFYGEPSKKMKIIGITGTNGKTTTSYLIRNILKLYGKKVGLIGTIKYIIDDEEIEAKHTTPESLQFQQLLAHMVDKKVEYLVTEVSSHALALKRVDYTDFDVAVFTNLSRDHLDFHKDMEDYFQAKMRLFTELLKKSGYAVINIDDPYGKRVAEAVNAEKILYCLDNPGADVYVERYSLKLKETTLSLVIKGEKIKVKSPLLGIPNIYNVLAATATALAFNIPLDVIKSGIEDAQAPSGRFEKVDEGQDFLAVVDYAHTPDALERLLLSVQKLKEQISNTAKIITIFGCGGNRDKGKRPQMGKIATELSDYVVVTSDNPRYEDPREIIRDIERGISNSNYIVVPDRSLAIWIGTRLCKKGDILIVAGKGHEDYQEIDGKRYHFSDREVLQNAIKQLRH